MTKRTAVLAKKTAANKCPVKKVGKAVSKKTPAKKATASNRSANRAVAPPAKNFVYTSEHPALVPEADKVKYNSMTVEERAEYLKSNAKNVRWQEMETFRGRAEEIKAEFMKDPMLGAEYAENYSETIKKGSATNWDLIGGRVTEGKENFENANWKLADDGEKYLGPRYLRECFEKSHHHPYRNRVLITPNITMNQRDQIPVYSDIRKVENGIEKLENVDEIKIPFSLTYEYGDVNRFNPKKEKELEEALKEAEKPENMIRCECHTPGKPVVNCWENESCPCFKTNHAMRKFQRKSQKLPTTTFATNQPVLINSYDCFFKNVGFACSSACACGGKCDNNVMHIAESRVYPLELFRRNENVGFELRSPVAIPAGTPICEFTGDISKERNLDPADHDYDYQMADNDDKPWINFAERHKKWTPAYKKLLKKMHRTNYYCNPKIYGNVGRTVGHGCIANVEVLRVFQKSLSPAHARLIMVSLVDIFPGVPLTIDYGKRYFNEQLANYCLCGTLACPRMKYNEQFKKYDAKVAGTCLKYVNDYQRQTYLDKIFNCPVATDERTLARLIERKRKGEDEPVEKNRKLTETNN